VKKMEGRRRKNVAKFLRLIYPENVKAGNGILGEDAAQTQRNDRDSWGGGGGT